MNRKLFGTDGIRGTANSEPMTADIALRVGMAAGRHFTRGAHRHRVVIGKDTRLSGYMIEPALTSGFVSMGMDVILVGPLPTPAVAMLTRSLRADLGVMISASHNPYEDNGIKLFGPDAYKLSDEVEAEIECRMAADMSGDFASPARLGRALRLDDAQGRYTEHVKQTYPKALTLDGLKVVVDCANGAASHVGPRLFEQLGAKVTALFAEPDGLNINEGCGSTHPAALQRCVREAGVDLGIALDGDADRCLLVDETGELVHGDGILTLLARHAVENDAWSDTRVVATVMSNRGLHRALREVGVEVVTVGVGDRRVSEALRREELPLGGEQSGHIIFGAENHHVGDGLYTALRVLRVMRESDRPLSALASPYRPFPQVLVNVPVASKPDFSLLPSVEAAVHRIEDELAEDGRVLLRYSGTESLARVMVEGPDAGRIRVLADELAALLGDEIGVADGSR